MDKQLAQPVIVDALGQLHIEDDWYPAALPENAVFEEMSYPDTSYSYKTFYSKKPKALTFDYASGNYGNSSLTAGVNGVINIGKFVVLVSTNLISNKLIKIHDHCMFSWGSIITDSWITPKHTLQDKRNMLQALAHSPNRHLEFTDPQPVTIEENAWIGFDAIIMPGATIGHGAIVGCKSVVYENVPPYAIVVGNPARIVKYLNPTDTEEIRQNALRAFNATCD